jgi:hypothetical protein
MYVRGRSKFSNNSDAPVICFLGNPRVRVRARVRVTVRVRVRVRVRVTVRVRVRVRETVGRGPRGSTHMYIDSKCWA